jgi:hypothetical protein
MALSIRIGFGEIAVRCSLKTLRIVVMPRQHQFGIVGITQDPTVILGSCGVRVLRCGSALPERS